MAKLRTELEVRVDSSANTGPIDKTNDSVKSLDDTARSNKIGEHLKRSFDLALKGAVALGLAVGGITTVGFDFNSQLEQAQAKIQAFTKSNERTADILDFVRKEAADTQFSFGDMADAAANLIPISKASGVSLEALVKQAEILAALNPGEGLTGAAFSLREALTGDFVSIVERFNLPRQRLNELRKQGVPAMKAIQTALEEMGIDFSLVSKQGQTTAARWDQLKDRFTILAGTVTKPIFDIVSDSLDDLAKNINWGEIERKGVELTNGLIDGAKRAVEWLSALGREVWEYLGPKVIALWDVFSKKFIPVLERLWKEVIEPLVPLIGTTLVGALGLAVDAATALLEILVPLGNWMADNEQVVMAVVTAVGALWAIMKAKQAIDTFITNFNLGKEAALRAVAAIRGGQGIGGIKSSLGGLSTGLAGFTAWNAWAALAAGAIGIVIADVQRLQSEFNKLISMSEQAERAQTNARKNVEYTLKDFKAGKATREDLAEALRKSYTSGAPLPSFAGGVQNFEGGLAYVHQGEALVNLPKGTDVIPKHEVERGAVGGQTINVTNNIYNDVDVDMMVRRLGFALAHA